MELNCTIQVAIDINKTYCWISCPNVYHADFTTPTIVAVMINCIRTTDIIWLPSRHEKHFHLWNTPMWEIQAASHLCFNTALNTIILLLSDWIKSDWLTDWLTDWILNISIHAFQKCCSSPLKTREPDAVDCIFLFMAPCLLLFQPSH